MAVPDGRPILLLLLVERSPWWPLLPLQISIEPPFMWSVAASHRATEPTVSVREREAACPAVTDCHSHSYSFTNMSHSFHAATTARSHVGMEYHWTAITNLPTSSDHPLEPLREPKGFTLFMEFHTDTFLMIHAPHFLV